MTPRLRIAFVHDSYPAYRRPLFELLARRYDLRFFFLNQNPAALPPNSVSLRAWRIPEMSDFLLAPGLTGRILAEHRREPFDAVLCPEPASYSALAAGRAARRMRLPYAVFSGEWYPARHPRRALTYPFERALVRGAAACLAYGTRVRDRLAAMGADPRNILISGNASPYRFERASAAEIAAVRRDWGIGDAPVILFLGRLLSFKAPEILIEAFPIVRRSRPAFLLMEGSGPLQADLRRRAERLAPAGARISGREIRTDAEKNLLYSLAGVFVLPSRKARIAEPWGLVLNEAAAAGLPIVTTDGVGAAGDLIRDGETGRVVPQGDAAALAAAILDFLQSPEAAAACGRRAREQAGAFTIERMADAFGRAFELAAGAGR
jgi:glycosyltransferase involved in cell wall biosynthesis